MNVKLRELKREAMKARRATERRNDLIAEATEAGATRRQVAEASGLSVGAVQQILRRIGALTLVAFVAFTASASALTLNPASPQYQRWLDASLMPTAPSTVTFDATAAQCGTSVEGCATPDYIGLSMRGSQQRAVLLHEAGHVFDFAVLTDADRRALAVAMPGRPSNPALWWTPQGQGNTTENGEWFADSYSACARVPRSYMVERHRGDLGGRSFSTGDGVTSGRRLARVCSLIRSAE